MPGTRILARVGTACAIALSPSLSACGGSDDQGTIPQGEGDAVLSQLDELRGELDAGDCDAAEATGQEIRDNVEAFASELGSELEEALVQASDNLALQTREQCEPPEEEEPPEPEPGATGEAGFEESP